jgi:pseudouridine kinase
MSKSVLCIGATLVDELYFCEDTVVPNSSNPAQKTTSIGGVISNVVQHLALLDVHVSLITALGSDSDAAFITDSFQKMNIALNDAIIVDDSTGKYVSILNPDGSLNVAVCQDISDKYITIPFLESKVNVMRNFDLIIIDTNLATDTIQWLINFAKANAKTLIIEPVSVSKASKLAGLNLDGVYMITPNEEELVAICESDTQKEQLLVALFDRGVQTIWLRKGAKGSVLFTASQSIDLLVPSIQILDSTGAGDAALAGWVFGYLQNYEELECLKLGHALAFEILKIKGSVDFTMNKEKLYTSKNIYYHE